MKVEEYLKESLKQGKVHLTLLDPEDQDPEKALEIATEAVAGGSNGIMLGGSTTDSQELDETAKLLQKNLDVPIILFPGNTTGVSAYADAIFFMSLLNSNNPYWIVGAQALGAPKIKKIGIETIPMGYLIVEPGETAGWVGDAKLIPRRKPDLAVAYALAAEFMGMRLFYLEAGSGAAEIIPQEMIQKVKMFTNHMVIVGGGIRTGEAARKVAQAGADIIVTGTVVENTSHIKEKISEIVEGLKSVQ
ncbi:geranylgeranylglyceryl/heptaprenylglyceryl phosphate synthase [Methanobacterium ferruginis]|jgi:phosphoglycerol geranylgeranyltransferase|uniref:geranylgeranylglyceryl/heptaprenylglyceryl phosphate synthase n=1 Tax=Methanobacterium ferruginis TaxID=710191 RepID=UPI002573A271|nr:geranylgeranylglyceryl/heptaprenylglyceryl phosphate synthase [Methanobacterium ferruginis]MCC7550938.1 geranylgeranylglyceryl/heptaprenylglyceryl phosphate synthase [Methanobacterium sp.]BDZ67879.1 geranylgeranylglyceryl/heptaprenylglyceryl phosphate synthase [Methanobacterium ferruginis]